MRKGKRAMPGFDATRIATELIFREGALLDRRDWQAWLEMYVENAVFWIPAWRDENTQIDDPDREISLIYHDSRAALEERVVRVQSKKTVTAAPLPRTAHFITGISVSKESAEALIEADSVWSVMSYNPRTSTQSQLFGRYVHHFVLRDGTWRIAMKRITLLNDRVPTMLDFYSV
jgi:3-phenylpropionate/cinnamic acid dioxygenase small subunit